MLFDIFFNLLILVYIAEIPHIINMFLMISIPIVTFMYGDYRGVLLMKKLNDE